MVEYISREALEKWLLTEMASLDSDADRQCVVERLRKEITAADVRPVVLCRDCKWYQIDELKKDGTADRRYKPSVCVLAEQRRDPNHFCADGVKREES